ncbi:hypothetical protein GCM10022278_00070 [Allohahella marinimesophila]|uniref:Uncharacterized protein n=1 Tax=Allohahella marinimesophila TaxID=1054972 RepID=A0ABP7NF15_9GAMM
MQLKAITRCIMWKWLNRLPRPGVAGANAILTSSADHRGLAGLATAFFSNRKFKQDDTVQLHLAI